MDTNIQQIAQSLLEHIALIVTSCLAIWGIFKKKKS